MFDIFDPQLKPKLEAIFFLDQLAAWSAGQIKLAEFLSGHCDNDPFDLKYLNDFPSGGMTVCGYSKVTPFYCDLERRIKCPGLSCTYWVEKLSRGENQ